MTKSRVRDDDATCPHCGSNMKIREEMVEFAEPSLGESWVPSKRWCPRGCKVTADEMRAGELPTI